MRQRNWFIANLIFLVCLSAWLLCGCSDDPQTKTVKDAKQKTYDALTQLDAKRDPNTASRYFQESLQSRPGSAVEEASTMASTNLLKTQTAKKIASYRIASLALKTPLNALADELKTLSDKTAQLQRTNNLVTLADNELLELQKVLAGEQNPDSLVAKCTAAKAQLDELTAKQNAYQKEYDSALATKLDLENQAQQQLRLAESLKDADQKTAAEKKRFDLLSQRIPYDIQIQDAENKLGQVASQRAIITPYLAQLEQDRKKTETRIESLKNSEQRSHLLTLSQDLSKEIGQLQNAVVGRAAQLKMVLDSNTAQFEDRMAELVSIAEQYQSVRGRQWAFLAAMSLGDAHASAGSICAVRIKSLLDLGAQYEGLMLTYDSIVPDSVKKISLLSSKADAALLQKAADSFDAADKAYLEAFDMADKNGQCSILKARLLTLKEKLLLADRLGDFDTANKTQSAIDELTKSAPDICDQFVLSTTANLVAKGIDYIPSPQVNMAMIIESIQKEFAQWRSFRGSQQETEVNKLTSRIDQLKTEFPGDTQLAQFLDQESKAMEAARTRGFAAEAAAENGDPNAIETGENSDPNGKRITESTRIDLPGKHKDYPIDIFPDNIDTYYGKFMAIDKLTQSNPNVSSMERKKYLTDELQNNEYFRSMFIPSDRYGNIDERILEEINANEWGTASVDEDYFRITKNPPTNNKITYVSEGLYQININLRSEFRTSRTKADGTTNLKEDFLQLILLLRVSSKEAAEIEEHFKKNEPMLATWKVNYENSGITKTENTTSGILIQQKMVVYHGTIEKFVLLPNSDKQVKNVYDKLDDIEKFNQGKTIEYLKEEESDLSHDPQIQLSLDNLEKKRARDIEAQKQKAENAPKEIADHQVNSLISSGVIKSAIFTGYKDYRGDSISAGGGLQPGKKVYADYNVEYVTKGGLIKQGNVGILVYVDDNFQWKYGQTYLNGQELWLNSK